VETVCHNQLIFESLFNKEVVADFAGGRITSDAGGLLLRELDQRYRLAENVAQCLHDPRDSHKVKHDLLTLVRQRMFAIAQGYEDNNDAATLARDPALQGPGGRNPTENPLAPHESGRALRNRHHGSLRHHPEQGVPAPAHSLLCRPSRRQEGTLLRVLPYLRSLRDQGRKAAGGAAGDAGKSARRPGATPGVAGMAPDDIVPNKPEGRAGVGAPVLSMQFLAIQIFEYLHSMYKF
jgi:Transposase DDE domain group 1